MSTISTTPSARITLLPSGKQFESPPHKSLLDAGLSAGHALPFGCANGTCGDCRARVCKGQISKHRHHEYTLTEAEKLHGVCLLCSNTAVTDCQIEVLEASTVDDIPLQQYSARLCRIDTIENTVIVAYKFSRGKALRFLPGQQAVLGYSDGVNITLPIASCPCNAHALEFHLTPESLGTDQLHDLTDRISNGKSRDRVQITGPYGQFTLSANPTTPKLFVVRGGEFGQVQGMIEQVFNLELDTPCCLLWVCSTETGHYQHNLCRAWQDAFDEFDYVPLKLADDPLSYLPPQWSDLLGSAEAYFGGRNEPLIERLLHCGMQSDNIYFPESPPD